MIRFFEHAAERRNIRQAPKPQHAWRSSDVSEAVKDLKVTPKQLAQVEQATSKALDEYFIAMRKLQEEARLDQQRIAAECEARLLAPLTEQQQQKFRELFGQPLTKSDQAAGL
ncbi:MAG: hypothetical protein KDA87_23315 [Planctomycetales bacterium]|nr:hypothetical protein [Planctomycetales bacterium]